MNPRVIRNLNASYNLIEVDEDKESEQQIHYVFNSSLTSNPGLPRAYQGAIQGSENKIGS